MFKFLKNQKKKGTFFAPVSGNIVKLEEVSDPVFAQKAMGEGIGIEPTDKSVFSPIDAEVINVFKTKHAIGLKTNNGLDILIHIGLDTVELKGVPFDIKVSKGDRVTSGMLLAVVDFQYIKKMKKDPVVLTLITNSKEVLDSIDIGNAKRVEYGDEIFTYMLN